MELFRALRKKAQQAAIEDLEKKGSSQSGIALFMVISAISILSILVTEFTYVAQMNQKLAYDGLDQVKALYLAKSGLKISLLRLKAYQTIKQLLAGNAGASMGVPKSLVEKIWSFPFMFPIPTAIPGLSVADKEKIDEFQKSSSLDGSYSALIESESSKYNLNTILAQFVPPAATGATGVTGPTGTSNESGENGVSGVTGATAPTGFDPEAARASLQEYIGQIIQQKMEDDQDFAEEYRDFKIEDLMDNIVAWADPTYEKKTPQSDNGILPKKAPFYSLSELHMVQGMDDQLYNLLAPSLTVSTTPGINVNTMKEDTLLALVPQMTKEERQEFFTFRDSQEEDNNFKKGDDFFKYLQDKVAIFSRGTDEITKFKQGLEKKGIRIVTEESNFKITIRSQVNQASKTLEAWLTMSSAKDKSPGLKITFMRIL